MKSWKRQNYSDKNSSEVARGWEWEKGSTTKGHKEIFSGNGTVLYLDCGGGYATVYNLENSSNCTFKMCGLYCM